MPSSEFPDAAARRVKRLRLVSAMVGLVVAVAVAVLSPPDWQPERAELVVQWSGDERARADVASLSAQTATVGAGRVVASEINAGRISFCFEPVSASASPPVAWLALPDGRLQSLPVDVQRTAGGCYPSSIRSLQGGRWALSLLALVAIFLTLEVIALHWTALSIPVLASVAGLGTSKALLAPFFHPVIALFFAGFLLAAAMVKSGLDQAIAVRAVRLVGPSARRLYVAMVSLAAFFSMWMSNTASMAAMLPILMAVTGPTGDKQFRRCLVLATAYAASIGGIGSAIGTPANPLAMGYLADFAGESLGFADWFFFGLPMVVMLLPVMATVVWFRYGVSVEPEGFRAGFEAISRDQRPLSSSQRVVLTVFLLMVGGWLLEGVHGRSASMVGLAGVIVLGVLGQVGKSELRSISWDSLLVFGGGLCLGDVLVSSGASDWVATQLSFLNALPPAVGTGAVAAVTLLLSAVASNTAAAATILPLAIPLATVIGVPPATLVVVVAIASSIDFALVVGTPPTMIAYSTGLYTVREIFTTGVVVDLLGLILLVAVLPLVWGLLGVV